MDRIEGKVAKLPEGKYFGFIQVGKNQYFFHKEGYNDNWSNLKIGDRVEGEPSDGPKGLRMDNVSLVK